MFIEENKLLGFSDLQWDNAVWLSAFGQDVSAFWIYARRKGHRYKKLWAGITDDQRKLGIITQLKMSFEDWDRTRNEERREILKSLSVRYWQRYKEWEIIEHDNGR